MSYNKNKKDLHFRQLTRNFQVGAVAPRAEKSLISRLKDKECDKTGENQPWRVVGLQIDLDQGIMFPQGKYKAFLW